MYVYSLYNQSYLQRLEVILLPLEHPLATNDVIL